MDSQLFAGPVIGIFCTGLNAYCMQTGPLFLRISGSSDVLKAFLLERNRQLSCNPKKKQKKKKKLCKLPAAFTCFGQQVSVSVQPSLLAKAHLYQQRAQTQPPAHPPTMSQSPRQRRRKQQKDIGHHTLGNLFFFFFFFFFWEGKIFITQVQ